MLGCSEADLAPDAEPEPEPESVQPDGVLGELESLNRGMSKFSQIVLDKLSTIESAAKAPDCSKDLNEIKDLLKRFDSRLYKLECEVEEIEGHVNQIRTNTQNISVGINRKHTAMEQILEKHTKRLGDMKQILYDMDASGNIVKILRAKELLERMIETGTAEENDIYNAAAEEKISKKYIDRAKSEMGLVVVTQGYGINQKKKWIRGQEKEV